MLECYIKTVAIENSEINNCSYYLAQNGQIRKVSLDDYKKEGGIAAYNATDFALGNGILGFSISNPAERNKRFRFYRKWMKDTLNLNRRRNSTKLSSPDHNKSESPR